MATRIKFPSLRHQSPSRKKANKSIGGTGAADGNTKGASELHAATPDWIKDVGGKYMNRSRRDTKGGHVRVCCIIFSEQFKLPDRR